MRWILKTILLPISLLLSVLSAFFQFIVGISNVILMILSGVIFLGSLAAFIQKDVVTGIQGLVIAFLVSPYGLPKILLVVIKGLETVNGAIKSI